MAVVLRGALIREEFKVLATGFLHYGFETVGDESIVLNYSDLVETRRQLRGLLRTVGGLQGRQVGLLLPAQ